MPHQTLKSLLLAAQRFLGPTKQATIAFVGVVGLGFLAIGGGVVKTAQFVAVALVVAPLVWGLMARKGTIGHARGSVAGAIIGALIWLVPLGVVVLQSMSGGGSHDASLSNSRGGSGISFHVAFAFLRTIPAMILGAAIGLVITRLEKQRGR